MLPAQSRDYGTVQRRSGRLQDPVDDLSTSAPPRGDTIAQLLGYVSWRDTKTAIVIFNRNKNFSRVAIACCVKGMRCSTRVAISPAPLLAIFREFSEA
jgi:hypothetical protein